MASYKKDDYTNYEFGLSGDFATTKMLYHGIIRPMRKLRSFGGLVPFYQPKRKGFPYINKLRGTEFGDIKCAIVGVWGFKSSCVVMDTGKFIEFIYRVKGRAVEQDKLLEKANVRTLLHLQNVKKGLSEHIAKQNEEIKKLSQENEELRKSLKRVVGRLYDEFGLDGRRFLQ